MWDSFNGLGDRGWELVSASPIADARWGNPNIDTARMLFIFFKRHKPYGTAATPEVSTYTMSESGTREGMARDG